MRSFLRTNWRGVTIGVTALAIFCAAILVLSTMPPRAIVMATGPEGGGFEEVGRQYRSALERAGVQVRLVETAGSMENLALLRDPRSGVNVALIHAGSTSASETPELESLGTLFYEPLYDRTRPMLHQRKNAQSLIMSKFTARSIVPPFECTDWPDFAASACVAGLPSLMRATA